MRVLLISVDREAATLGLRSLSSYLKAHGHEVRLVLLPWTEDFAELYPQLVMDQVADLAGQYDVTGISVMTITSLRAYQVSKVVRSLGRTVVMGGIHPTQDPEAVLPHADYLVISEGEETFAHLLETLQADGDPASVPGLVFQRDGQTVRTGRRPLIHDLDALPYLDYDLETQLILDEHSLELVPVKEHHLRGEVLVHTARGCPFKCSFCCHSKLRDVDRGLGKPVRRQGMDRVMDELVHLKSHIAGLRSVFFTDDVFTVRPLEELKLFAVRYRREVGLPFHLYVAPGTFDEEAMGLLVDAGLRAVYMGIQTGSDRLMRELYDRPLPRAKVLESAAVLNRFVPDLVPHYQFIINNPYEAEEDCMASLELILALPRPFELQIFNLDFYPGTTLFDRAKADGVLQANDEALDHVMYFKFGEYIRRRRKNVYLNHLLHWCRDRCNEWRTGMIPNRLLPLLLRPVVRRVAGSGLAYPVLRALDHAFQGFWRLEWMLHRRVLRRSTLYRKLVAGLRAVLARTAGAPDRPAPVRIPPAGRDVREYGLRDATPAAGPPRPMRETLATRSDLTTLGGRCDEARLTEYGEILRSAAADVLEEQGPQQGDPTFAGETRHAGGTRAA